MLKYEIKPIFLDGEKTKYVADTNGDIFNSETNYKLSLQLDKDGYYIVKITHNGRSITKRVNQLVASAFIPNPENKPEAHHIDRDRQNNKPSNLQWCTRKEHFDIERRDFNKFTRSRGERNGSAQCTDDTMRTAALEMCNGVSVVEVSKKFNISKSTLYDVYNKKSWTHITGDLEFPERTLPSKDNYSNELKNNILKLLLKNLSPRQISKELNLVYTDKLKNYIKTLKNRKIKKKGSTTIESDDMYDDNKYYVIDIH